MKRILAILAALPVLSSTAYADETVCRGALGAITVDNLVVPDGGRCRLDGTTVEGTITVGTDATLRATGVEVIGNIQAEGSRLVFVRLSEVGGSISVVQGQSATVRDSAITNDILFDEETGPLTALGNDVGGNIQVFANSGGVTIRNNFVDGNLQCNENEPDPVGGGNVVEGNKEDECADL